MSGHREGSPTPWTDLKRRYLRSAAWQVQDEAVLRQRYIYPSSKLWEELRHMARKSQVFAGGCYNPSLSRYGPALMLTQSCKSPWVYLRIAGSRHAKRPDFAET